MPEGHGRGDGGACRPLAGLRYFDAVLDTGYMDMRLVDIVSIAPNSIRARLPQRAAIRVAVC